MRLGFLSVVCLFWLSYGFVCGTRLVEFYVYFSTFRIEQVVIFVFVFKLLKIDNYIIAIYGVSGMT